MTKKRRILLIRSGAVGDMIYATVVIDALMQQYSDASIELLTTPAAAALFASDQRIAAIHLLQHRKLPTLLSRAKQQIIRLSKIKPYDTLINLETSPIFQRLAKRIKAQTKIGAPFTQPQASMLNEHSHNVDKIKAIIAPLIKSEILAHCRPRLYGSHFDAIKQRFSLPEKYIIIHASNSHNAKKGINYRAWPLQHWRELLHRLPTTLPIVFIGTRTELPFYNALKPFSSHHIDAIGKTTLSELITLIAQANLIITTDTGPVHLASAMQTPTIALIGPTPAYETGPYQYEGYDCTIISSHQPCAPCYKTDVMRACTFNACMHEISVQSVQEAIMQKSKPMQATIS